MTSAPTKRRPVLRGSLFGLSPATLLSGPTLADDRFIENQTIPSPMSDLTFEKGFPTGDTAERLLEFRNFYRVVEVIQQNVFAASLTAMRKGY